MSTPVGFVAGSNSHAKHGSPAPILHTTAFSISKRPTQPSPASNVYHLQDNHRLRRVCNTYCRNGRLDLRSYKTRGHQEQRVPAKGQDSGDPITPLISLLHPQYRYILPPGTRTLLSHASRPAPEPFELS
jgi:hypothetical protein